MNIVIPAAGRGERFTASGFKVPKPIIDVNGIPMIQAAVESLGLEGKYIFIVYDYEKEEFNHKIKEALAECHVDPTVIKINYITQGPASSALLAKELINNDEPLIITNCDQIMKWDPEAFKKELGADRDRDGLVVTYDSNTPKNSYIKIAEHGWADELAEKKVISNLSLNGIHYWSKGGLFVKSAEAMIKKNIRVNNEFYISETYNQLIKLGYNIDNYHIPAEQHCAIGVPEDLQRYLDENS